MKHVPDGWFTVAAVARLLGCSTAGLSHHIDAGRVPKPNAVWNRRRYFLAEDVERIRQFWASRVPERCSWFTSSDLAEMKRLWLAGMRQADIAAQFGATQTNISLLLTGVMLPGWRGGSGGKGRVSSVQRRRRNV